MVDRITPATTDADRDAVRERFGIEDRWPVVCEPFIQWVLEDAFSAGRPPYEDVGVQVVEDVEPYELMKLRLLNASHQALAYFGHLLGHRTSTRPRRTRRSARSCARYMDEEATPTLPPVPGIDLDDYKATLIERFSNPGVSDTLARLCAESSDRIPKWLLPVVRERLERAAGRARGGGGRELGALRGGRRRAGRPIEIVDRLHDRVTALARRASARTPTLSSPTASSSATSPSTSGSSRPTGRRSPRSTSEARATPSPVCSASRSAPPPSPRRRRRTCRRSRRCA